MTGRVEERAWRYIVAALALAFAAPLAGCPRGLLKDLGESCAQDEQCRSRRCAELVCKSNTQAQKGEVCSHRYECATENCQAGLCAVGTRAPGEKCSHAAQCRTEICVASTCHGAVSDLGPTDEAGACIADTCRDGPASDASRDGGSVRDRAVADLAPDVGPPGSHRWSKRFGGVGYDVVGDIAIATDGTLYLAGSFSETITIGGKSLVSAGGRDAFLAALDGTGQASWVVRIGGKGVDHGGDVAVDLAGNAVVTGYFSETATFGDKELVSVGGSDDFIAAFDPKGKGRWLRRVGDYALEFGLRVGADTSGNFHVTGSARGNLDFGGGSLGLSYDDDVVVGSFDNQGQHRWSRKFGDGQYDHGLAIAADGKGNIFLAGYHKGSIDFGGGPLVSAGGYDVFVVGFDSAGTHRWSKRFGNAVDDVAFDLAVANDGNVFVVGSFQRTIRFGGGTLTSAGGYDMFVASFDVDGVHRWSRRFGDAQGDDAMTVAVGPNGTIAIGGGFSGGVDFGSGLFQSAGKGDAFVVSLDGEVGKLRWAHTYGGSDYDLTRGVAFDKSGHVIACGYFQGEADFGAGVVQSAGDRDIFLIKFSP